MLSPQTCDSGAQLSVLSVNRTSECYIYLSKEDSPRLRHILLNLGVVLTIAGALTLSGCAATDGQATEEDVNNNVYLLEWDGVSSCSDECDSPRVHRQCQHLYAVLCWWESLRGNRFGSCILTVGTSTYAPETGPQANDVMTLNPCDFDSTNRTLKVSNGPITATSNPAIARLVNATASDLNDKSFLFTSGAVFNVALANIAVTLKFTNNANDFTLTPLITPIMKRQGTTSSPLAHAH